MQTGDLGSYTAIVSNAFGVVTSTPAALTLSAPMFYEPFDYANIGSPVSSNTPANWSYGGSLPNDFGVTSGSLSYTGLAASMGNSATIGGAGLGARRIFGTSFSSGKVYFSALFRINDLGYGASGWSGAAAQVGALTVTNSASFRLQIMVKSNSASGYVFGVLKGGSGAIATFDATEYHAGDTVLLAGQYDFTVSPNTATLWINPSSSTFGYSQPASGFISASTGTDSVTNVIDRFNFRQNTVSSVPAAMQWDELRVSASWSDVTPPFVPPLPQITAHPTNQTVSVGGTANFSVSASSVAPLSYQWLLSGTNLPNATNSVYKLTNAQRYYAGTYAAVVANSGGSVSSSNASLTVMPGLPVRLQSATNLGNGRFSFTGSGDPGSFAILASTNLADWIEATNLFSTNGTFQYTDWLSNAPARYFRARLVP